MLPNANARTTVELQTFVVQKFCEFLQVCIKVNFHDKNFVITFKFSRFNVVLSIFQQVRYIGHFSTGVQILNFVSKIFMISRLIMKFTKILCHENLKLYSNNTYQTENSCGGCTLYIPCRSFLAMCPCPVTSRVSHSLRGGQSDRKRR